MVTRDLFSSRLGQAFAVVWTFAQPTIIIAVYIVVFTTLFRTQLLIGGAERTDSDLYILAGLIPWLFAADTMARSCGIFQNRSGFVQHFTLPLCLLPASAVAAAAIPFLVQMALLVAYCLAIGAAASILLLLPVLLVLTMAAVLGIAMALSAATVFSNTLTEFVRVFITIGFFVTPILWLFETAPPVLQITASFIPFTYFWQAFQDLFFYGGIHHPVAWLVVVVFSCISLSLGVWVFSRLSHRFAGVL